MYFGVDTIEFRNEYVWGDKYELKGTVKVGIGAELGDVLENKVTIYQDMTFGVSKLPKEIQDKLIDVYKDIQTFFEKNSEFKLK